MSHKTVKRYVLYTLKELNQYSYSEGETIVTYTTPYIKFGWVPMYFTRERLVDYLAINKYYNIKDDVVLSNLSKDMSEVKPDYKIVRYKDYFSTNVRHIKKYIYLYFIGYKTPNGISAVDVNSLETKVENKLKAITTKREMTSRKIEAERRAQQFKFRHGSVVNTGHSNWHRGTYYRVPKLKNVKTLNSSCEEETKQFVKAKYKVKNLPVWDDRVRHNDRSWKTNSKVKRQWMKHLNNHIDIDISWKELTSDLD